MTAANIALDARRNGSGWMALCPAHHDTNASLSIRSGHDRKVLVHCHAGCEQAQVIGALRSRGLWSGPLCGRFICEQQTRPANRSRIASMPSVSRQLSRSGMLPGLDVERSRDVSQFARTTHSTADDAPLPCRAEASLGRHLAGDGRAGDPRIR
jgi:hypothetical protein